MHIERYTLLRRELIDLYRLFTERTFVVIIPMASFLSFEELKKRKDNPPLTGFETLLEPVERPLTISFLLRAIEVMGDDINMGFKFPRQDVPVIFESIQKWIQHWIEIKLNADYFQTPPVKELELIEKLGRIVFTAYAHYHHEKINKSMRISNTKELTLMELLSGRIQFGADFDEPISYISHLDQYKSQSGYTGYSGGNDDTLSFLKGFGGGL